MHVKTILQSSIDTIATTASIYHNLQRNYQSEHQTFNVRLEKINFSISVYQKFSIDKR